MSCFSGCVAGVLGLTGLYGFAFYLFAQLVCRGRSLYSQLSPAGSLQMLTESVRGRSRR